MPAASDRAASSGEVTVWRVTVPAPCSALTTAAGCEPRAAGAPSCCPRSDRILLTPTTPSIGRSARSTQPIHQLEPSSRPVELGPGALDEALVGEPLVRDRGLALLVGGDREP